MTVTKAMSSLSPLRFIGGTRVLGPEAKEVLEQANWTAGEAFEPIFTWSRRPDQSGLLFDDTERTRFLGRVFVPMHWRTIFAQSFFVHVTGTVTGRVRVFLEDDTYTANLSMSQAGTGSNNASLTLDATHRGLKRLGVVLDRTAGTGTLTLVGLEVRSGVIAAGDLATPGDE